VDGTKKSTSHLSYDFYLFRAGATPTLVSGKSFLRISLTTRHVEMPKTRAPAQFRVGEYFSLKDGVFCTLYQGDQACVAPRSHAAPHLRHAECTARARVNAALTYPQSGRTTHHRYACRVPPPTVVYGYKPEYKNTFVSTAPDDETPSSIAAASIVDAAKAFAALLAEGDVGMDFATENVAHVQACAVGYAQTAVRRREGAYYERREGAYYRS
jgi:hypothetical protein